MKNATARGPAQPPAPQAVRRQKTGQVMSDQIGGGLPHISPLAIRDPFRPPPLAVPICLFSDGSLMVCQQFLAQTGRNEDARRLDNRAGCSECAEKTQGHSALMQETQ